MAFGDNTFLFYSLISFCHSSKILDPCAQKLATLEKIIQDKSNLKQRKSHPFLEDLAQSKKINLPYDIDFLFSVDLDDPVAVNSNKRKELLKPIWIQRSGKNGF